MSERFWETTPLVGLTPEQWEALCDGCGKCCLEKFEAEDTGQIIYSRVACALLNLTTCRCQHYTTRAQLMPDCITLTPETLKNAEWLPETCAYRRLTEGKALPLWHPLLTGDPRSVGDAGHSVRGRVLAPKPGLNPLMNLIDWIR